MIQAMKMTSTTENASETTNEADQKLTALNSVQAVIEFDLDGVIQSANENFLKTLGYGIDEIRGKHHRMFCDAAYGASLDYKRFWEKLNRGEPVSGEFKRITRDGREIWVNASYTPMRNEQGQVYRVIKFATDVTEQKSRFSEFEGKMNAISKAQAMIEFNLDGTILSANENFLGTVGYPLDEIQNKHHRIFCDPEYASSSGYRDFWEKLRRGEYESGEYKRFGKGGKEIWINASYNPIFDANGKVIKVVKFATEVTQQKLQALESTAKMNAISKAQAIIEFKLDGTILTANDNFLSTLGYDLADIQGRHHRMFCDPEYVRSEEYADFWKKLNRGELDAGEYRRVGKGGKSIWINASYNPIFDADGKPYKVVKFATDITLIKMMIESINETAQALTSASTELTATATQMSGASEKTQSESSTAAAAAEKISAGVQIMATNMEEMVASIKEISRSANESSEMAKSTLTRALTTNKTISQLGVSSQEIGDVIKVISSIAQQTNLLALNATIEAARAGEAGKGFAVVANEVKELAKQTAKATNDITNKIGAIQKDTQSAVDDISGISTAVEKLNSVAGAIAAAVEEQTATTNEVSRVVLESKRGVENIAATIEVVSSAATENATASSQTLTASRELAGLATKLAELVKKAS